MLDNREPIEVIDSLHIFCIGEKEGGVSKDFPVLNHRNNYAALVY